MFSTCHCTSQRGVGEEEWDRTIMSTRHILFFNKKLNLVFILRNKSHCGHCISGSIWLLLPWEACLQTRALKSNHFIVINPSGLYMKSFKNVLYWIVLLKSTEFLHTSILKKSCKLCRNKVKWRIPLTLILNFYIKRLYIKSVFEIF